MIEPASRRWRRLRGSTRRLSLFGLLSVLGLTLYEFLTGPRNIPFLVLAVLFDVLVLGRPILLERHDLFESNKYLIRRVEQVRLAWLA